MGRILLLSFVVVLFGASFLEAKLLDIAVIDRPISACSGELSALARALYATKPEGYVDIANINPRPNLAEFTRSHRTRLGSSQRPRIEIYRLQEYPSVFLALSPERLIINLMTLRASLAIEAGIDLSNFDFVQSEFLVQIGGHDKTSDDLRTFYHRFGKSQLEAELPDSLNSTSRLRLEAEREFWSDFMIPQLRSSEQNGQPFVFLSSFVDPIKTESIAGHEVLHAIFFLNKDYRGAMIEFWRNQVSVEDKAYFINQMKSTYENMPQDEILAANEWQAYMLEPDSYERLRTSNLEDLRNIAPLSLKYRERMIQVLTTKNLPFIQLKARFNE